MRAQIRMLQAVGYNTLADDDSDSETHNSGTGGVGGAGGTTGGKLAVGSLEAMLLQKNRYAHTHTHTFTHTCETPANYAAAEYRYAHTRARACVCRRPCAGPGRYVCRQRKKGVWFTGPMCALQASRTLAHHVQTSSGGHQESARRGHNTDYTATVSGARTADTHTHTHTHTQTHGHPICHPARNMLLW